MAMKSMTGFGRGDTESRGRLWTVEVRCVNNRYLDVKMKLPTGYIFLEDKIRKMVADVHQRGRVDIFLSLSGDFSELVDIKINVPMARRYKSALHQLSRELSITGEITPELLASYPEVLVRQKQEEDVELLWSKVETAVAEALQNCLAMRLREGRILTDDLQARLEAFSRTIDIIEGAIPQLLQQRTTALQERLDKLLVNVQLDPARLAQEVAIMADKTDVTEEIVMLRSHIKQFRLFLGEDGTIGRKLDFLIQEFLREVNTLASKINDAEIAHHTVNLKSELEKMREQVQNIE
jgi:uncharacterized protein (TIGR00255 family)